MSVGVELWWALVAELGDLSFCFLICGGCIAVWGLVLALGWCRFCGYVPDGLFVLVVVYGAVALGC